MRRSCPPILAWCCRSKRSSCIIVTFLCVVCLLVWQSPQGDEGLRYDPVRSENKVQVNNFGAIVSVQSQNGTFGVRQRNAIEQCHTIMGPKWDRTLIRLPAFKDSPIVSLKHNLLYCPVGKVASSFFTRVVLAMNKPGPMTSPFNIPIELAGRGRCESLKSVGSRGEILTFLGKSTKVVFGRNPFSRIYSAFIDKLFSPNPFYWTYWGGKALKLDKASKAKQACASDVTFPQFLRLVLFDLHKNDVHLRQVYDECHMCDIVYDVIGTLETSSDDLDYLLGRLNVSSSFQHEKKYSFASKMDIVYDSVKSTFSWKKDISRCISLDQMGLRIWRKLQIRGIVDSSIQYPFKPGEMDTVVASTFIKACKKAVLMSTNIAQLKMQKEQAMLEAYKSVSHQDLLAIGRTFKNDFAMFGYNPKPAKLFESRDQIRQTGSLNWRKEWKLNTPGSASSTHLPSS